MATGTSLKQGSWCPQGQCKRVAEGKNILPLPVNESRNVTVENIVRGCNVFLRTQDHESATVFTAVPWNLRGWDSDLMVYGTALPWIKQLAPPTSHCGDLGSIASRFMLDF